MLFLKKVLYHFIIPPGIFIVSFLFVGCFLRGWRRYAIFTFAALMYLFSTTFIKDLLLYSLEKDYKNISCNNEVIVVLGGGVYGSGEIGEDTFKRVIKAYQKFDGSNKIVVSGGRLNEKLPYEADIIEKTLIDLGVGKNFIIKDTKSKDTVENAKFVKKIIDKNNLNPEITLITSAYHMKRAVLLFKKAGLVNICPEAADFKSDGVYSIYDFIPQASNLHIVSKAVKEYIGLLFYSLK